MLPVQKLEDNKALEERVKALGKKLKDFDKVTETAQKEESIIKEKKAIRDVLYFSNLRGIENPA